MSHIIKSISRLAQFLSPTVLLLVLSLILSSCNEQKDENVWIVGTAADNPPYEYIKDNEIVGLDIDIINAIGKHLGKKIVIKNLDFHGLIAALSGKTVDLVVAGLSVTPERQARADFSATYATSNIAILYRTQDALTDVSKLTDKIVGAQLGTVWDRYAKSLVEKHGIKIRNLSNNLALIEELKSKTIDAVVVEQQQARSFKATHPQLLSFIVQQETISDFAIAMPKGSSIKNDINNAIRALQDNGTIDAIIAKWWRDELGEI